MLFLVIIFKNLARPRRFSDLHGTCTESETAGGGNGIQYRGRRAETGAHSLTERLHALSKASLQGIAGADYRLVYKEGADKDFHYSLAMSIGANGLISGVLMDGIAYQAGFGPGMKILAVDGQPFTRPTLQQAIDAAKRTTTPIDFKVDNTGEVSDLRLDYHSGQRHPVLERVPNTPDRIAEIPQPMSR